jgi:hypothetical protein
MSSEIERLMKSAAAPPTSRIDWDAVRSRAGILRRNKRIALAATTVVACALVAGLALAASELTDDRAAPPANRDRGDESPFEPADPGDATYLLTDLRIEYPYVGAPNRLTGSRRESYCRLRPRECEPDPAAAGVSYDPHWATEEYPGSVACRITVYGEDGALLGSTIFELDVLDPSIVKRDPDIPVHVTAPPSEAAAVCEESTYKRGPGYAFRLIDVEPYRRTDSSSGEPLPPRTRLTFDVTYLTENPGTRECELVVRLTDGTVRRFRDLTLYIGQDKPVEMTPDIADPSSVKGADLRCRALTGS